MLRARYQSAREEDPERKDIQQARLADVISVLHSYIGDALGIRDAEKRPIPVRNKKFMSCFGQDCDSFFGALGFVKTGDDCFWHLPQVHPDDETAVDPRKRALLQDCREELKALMLNQGELRNTFKNFRSLRYESAVSPLSQIVGASTYGRGASLLRSGQSPQQEANYAFLGALPDFADEMIEFTFDRQRAEDYCRLPEYYDCLKNIAELRQSEKLMMKATMLASEGVGGSTEVAQAYVNLLGDSKAVSYGPTSSDDFIIERFGSVLQDYGAEAKARLRNDLRTIGVARNSQKMIHAADNVIQTYEQALQWLGVEDTTADDMITTMYGVKIQDDTSTTQNARTALKIIAEHRNSDALRSFLSTGDLGPQEVDGGECYRLLGIEDRTAPIDLGALLVQKDMMAQDNPSRKDEMERAYEYVVADKSGDKKPSLDQEKSSTNPAEAPVGLVNLGNTCYLNSLLQFYFTVKPLRELVLNFERHEVTGEVLKKRKIDQGLNSVKTVDRAQSLVVLLQDLFRRMIASQDHKVTYQANLARVALVKPSDDTDEDGSAKTEPGSPATNHQQDPEGAASDSSSEETLVGDDKLTPESDEDTAAENRTVPQDQPVGLLDGAQSEPTTRPDAPVEPAENAARSMSIDEDYDEDSKSKGDQPNPPSRPPPVPPRPSSAVPQKRKRDDLTMAEEYVRQQDVNEVLGNVLDQLELAFKISPSLDEEQRSLVENIFSGTEREEFGRISKEEVVKSIYVPLLWKNPITIYEALDRYFDPVRGSEVSDKFTTITKPPEILQLVFRRNNIVNGRAEKIDHYLKFKPKLHLDRYMDLPDTALMNKRQESWGLKAQLERLASREESLHSHTKELDKQLSEALEAAATYLSKIQDPDSDDDLPIDVPKDLPANLRKQKERVDEELANIASRRISLQSKLDRIFVGYDSVEYRLHTVFIHRGSAMGGHYWVYIYDFQKDVWRKYNDDYVSEISDPQKEIFDEDKPGHGLKPATPYCLIYVKDRSVRDLTEALQREIPASQRDVEMKDLQTIDGIDPSSQGPSTAEQVAKMTEDESDGGMEALCDYVDSL